MGEWPPGLRSEFARGGRSRRNFNDTTYAVSSRPSCSYFLIRSHNPTFFRGKKEKEKKKVMSILSNHRGKVKPGNPVHESIVVWSGHIFVS